MKYPITIILLLTLIFGSCKKEEMKPNNNSSSNQAPNSFEVETYYVDANTTDIDWNASDPDGDELTFMIILGEDTLETELPMSSGQEYRFEDLEYDLPYEGQVIAQDPGGLSYAAQFAFTTGEFPNNPPLAFNLISPEISSEFISLNPELEWESSSDPDGDNLVYDVFLGTSINPTELVADNISANSFTISEALDAETTYYWKVEAVDPYGATTETSVFSFITHPTIQASLVTDAPGWGARGGHKVLEFDNKLWVIGGETCCGGRFNDVWSSTDGQNWELVTDNAPWTGRSQFGATVFDGKMWLTGGNSSYTSGNEFNDVWSSTDGLNWTLETDNPEFAPRYGVEMVTFNGKMLVMGGRDAPVSYSRHQIWSSEDGVNWEMIYDDEEAFRITGAQYEVVDNVLYRLAHREDNVWKTSDGINWEMISDDIGCGSRYNHSTAYHNGAFYLMSGNDSSINESTEWPDVYISNDGITWAKIADDAGYLGNAQSELISFNGQLLMLGGNLGNGGSTAFDTIYSFE